MEMYLTGQVYGVVVHKKHKGEWEEVNSVWGIYDDGTNSYLATLVTGADIADNGNFASGQATVTNVVTFVGVADCTDLTAANLGTALIA